MAYRNWSKAVKKQWKPSKPLQLLEKMAEGAPRILKPEFKKCPTIDELDCGVQQVNARLSLGELDWWHGYIETEKKQRAFWENVSAKDLEKMRMPPSSFEDLKFVEEIQPQEQDQAAMKREADLDKLFEKGNNFPEVSR